MDVNVKMNYEQKMEFVKNNWDLIKSVNYNGVEILYNNIIDDSKDLNFFLNLSSKHIYYRKDLVEYQEILARAIIIVDDLNNEILDMNKEEIDENEND